MSVEAELWNIFTFYSLHSDANFPETWKMTSFARFAKDCQITSRKFMVSELELEIVRLVRNKRKFQKVGGVNGKDFDSSHTIVITFADFLRLLEIIAVRVYPGPPGSVPDPTTSLRRLLLENVLTLASRRSEHVLTVCTKSTTKEARAIVREVYGRALMGIFRYYLDLADKRRAQALATESAKTGVTGTGNLQQSKAQARDTKAIRDKLRSQRDQISFREYTQFCLDFELKSTELLTAIEVGEMYLNTVSYDSKSKDLNGMVFSNFCDAIVAMATFAYRNNAITPVNKVKALLHFMWRAVNQTETRAKIARGSVKASSQHAGSLNHFGSGPFSDHFLRHWIDEGFPNYSTPPTETVAKGTDVLQRIITKRFGGGDKGKDGDDDDDDDEGSEAQGSEQVGHAQAADEAKGGSVSAPGEPVVLHGFVLAALFRVRPELAEMMYLEGQGLQLNSELSLQ